MLSAVPGDHLTTSAPETSSSCDVAVVGAGIVGLACARELARRHPRLRLTVLDKEPRVAAHQTGHNSGVIHAGIYYMPGSLKARLCVEGARLLYDYCEEHAVPVERCGKLIVATTAAELPRLRDLRERAERNGVPGIAWREGGEIVEHEPHARGVAALHSPATGIVDYALVAERMADELRQAGHRILLGTEVRSAAPVAGGVRIVHRHGELRARRALFCAGAWADRLAAGAGANPRIIPFRGAYLLLHPERRHLVRGLIYPVPDPELPFLGVHLTRHVDGEVSLGPSALLVGARDAYRAGRIRPRDLAATLAWPGTYRMAWRFRGAAATEVRRALSSRRFAAEAARFVPELRVDDILPGPAGVRAQALNRDGTLVDDFVFADVGATLHVRNAPSPAATASLAIAREVADRFDRRALATP